MPIDKSMRIPPMVGVPIFFAWFSGANELTACPYFNACSFRIIYGPSVKPMASEVNTLNKARNDKYRTT